MIYTAQEINWHKQKLQAYLAYWRSNPLAFVIQACRADKFGYPVDWQASLLNRIHRTHHEAVASGHGVGKSRIEAWVAWWIMICHYQPGKPLKIPVTGPSGSNLADVLWSELELVRGHLHPWLAEHFVQNNEELYAIESRSSWFMKLRTARKENPDALQGFHGEPVLYIIDEASGVDDAIFKVARGALTGDDSYGLMCGNPVRLQGYFHRAFHAKTSAWHATHVSCLDQLTTRTQKYFWMDIRGKLHPVEVKGRVTQNYVDDMIGEFGARSPTVKARVLGQFPTTEDDQVVQTEAVNRARNREAITGDWPRVWGVDVAWQGEDDSALCERHGPCIESMTHWHGNDVTETSDRVISRYNDAKKSGKDPRWICVDMIGVGAGVYSNLRKAKLPAIGVHVGKAAVDDGGTKCHRLRDWLWWQCRLFFKDHGACFNGEGAAWDRLCDELTAPNYKYSPEGKVKVESKDELKKRGEKSPDLADALCLTMFCGYRGDRVKSDHGKKKQGRPRHGRKKQQVADRWALL